VKVLGVGSIDEGERAIGIELTDEFLLVFHESAIVFLTQAQLSDGLPMPAQHTINEKDGREYQYAHRKTEQFGYLEGVRMRVQCVRQGGPCRHQKNRPGQESQTPVTLSQQEPNGPACSDDT
jgi:hypothetical protein